MAWNANEMRCDVNDKTSQKQTAHQIHRKHNDQIV